MRYNLKRSLFLLLMVLNSAFCEASSPSEQLQGFTYYAQETISQSIAHVLEVNPYRFKMVSVQAKVTGVNRASVEYLAQLHQAIAAINGGFFYSDAYGNCVPAGVMKINHQWHGIAYQPRGAIAWSESANEPVLMDRIQTHTRIRVHQSLYPVYAMNRLLMTKPFLLFSDSYRYPASAPEYVQVNFINNKVTAVLDQAQQPILPNEYAYLMYREQQAALRIKPGDAIELLVEVLPQLLPQTKAAWQQAAFIVGGAPLLIKQGKRVTDYKPERLRNDFIEQRHARTAIGLKKNQWIFVVIEKNRLNSQAGLTIPELAEFMEQLGCQEALNLDGGTSSAIFLSNQVVNQNSLAEDEEFSLAITRKVSDVLMIVPRG